MNIRLLIFFYVYFHFKKNSGEVKRSVLLCFFFVLSVILLAQNKPFLSDLYSYLENTSLFELNQEEGHTPSVPYNTVSEALLNQREKSSNFMSLNGLWKFSWSDTPEGADPEFYKEIGRASCRERV